MIEFILNWVGKSFFFLKLPILLGGVVDQAFSVIFTWPTYLWINRPSILATMTIHNWSTIFSSFHLIVVHDRTIDLTELLSISLLFRVFGKMKSFHVSHVHFFHFKKICHSFHKTYLSKTFQIGIYDPFFIYQYKAFTREILYVTFQKYRNVSITYLNPLAWRGLNLL